MAHAHDAITIDPALHADLKKAAAAHPAAKIADSPLAKALKTDTAAGGQVANSTLTAYLTAVESGPLTGMTDKNRQALVARAKEAFPGR
jgi:hypothetical protein